MRRRALDELAAAFEQDTTTPRRDAADLLAEHDAQPQSLLAQLHAPPPADPTMATLEIAAVPHGDRDAAWLEEFEQTFAEPVATVTPGSTVRTLREGDMPGAPPTAQMAMVALYPSRSQAQRLAAPGGELPEKMHVTLAYLGKRPWDEHTINRIGTVVRNWASNIGAIGGVISGAGLFTEGDDGPVTYLSVDMPSLPALREELVRRLDRIDVPASRDHGFTPHMTIRYGEPNGYKPPRGEAITFDQVTVAVADQRWDFPFAGAMFAEACVLIEAALVDHAQRELDRAGLFDPDADYAGMLGRSVMKLVRTMEGQGHSGMSAEMAVDLFGKLARYQAITPLTSDPGEWRDVSEMSFTPDQVREGLGLWQNVRDSSAFSDDGGKTYTLLSETVGHGRSGDLVYHAAKPPVHTSQPHDLREVERNAMCPKCGNKQDKETTHCAHCGYKLREAKLTKRTRSRLPASAFAVPEDRSYPVHDEAHQHNALARVEQHGTPEEKRRVRAAVRRRRTRESGVQEGIRDWIERDHPRAPDGRWVPNLSRMPVAELNAITKRLSRPIAGAGLPAARAVPILKTAQRFHRSDDTAMTTRQKVKALMDEAGLDHGTASAVLYDIGAFRYPEDERPEVWPPTLMAVTPPAPGVPSVPVRVNPRRAREASSYALERSGRLVETQDAEHAARLLREGWVFADLGEVEQTRPGTNWTKIPPKNVHRLQPIIDHYKGMAHPFTACVRDQIKHGLSEDHAHRRCAVVKDLGMKTTKWRKGPHKVTEATATAAPAGPPPVRPEDDPEFNWRRDGGKRGVTLRDGSRRVVDAEMFDRLKRAGALDEKNTPEVRGDIDEPDLELVDGYLDEKSKQYHPPHVYSGGNTFIIGERVTGFVGQGRVVGKLDVDRDGVVTVAGRKVTQVTAPGEHLTAQQKRAQRRAAGGKDGQPQDSVIPDEPADDGAGSATVSEAWTERLHPRDPSGRFTVTAAASGRVLASNTSLQDARSWAAGYGRGGALLSDLQPGASWRSHPGAHGILITRGALGSEGQANRDRSNPLSVGDDRSGQIAKAPLSRGGSGTRDDSSSALAPETQRGIAGQVDTLITQGMSEQHALAQIASARGMTVAAVRALFARHGRERTIGEAAYMTSGGTRPKRPAGHPNYNWRRDSPKGRRSVIMTNGQRRVVNGSQYDYLRKAGALHPTLNRTLRGDNDTTAPPSSGRSGQVRTHTARSPSGGMHRVRAYVRAGDQGGTVRAVQAKVGANPDGKFGNQTRQRVMSFQRKNGLVVDGIVGKQTASAMLGNTNARNVGTGAMKASQHRKLFGARPKPRVQFKQGRARGGAVI